MKKIYNMYCQSCLSSNPDVRHSCAGRNLILLAVLIISALFLTSCSDFVSPKRYTQDHYTLNALLMADSTISVQNPVFISKGVDLSQLNDTDMFVLDAIVTIKEYQKNSATNEYDILTKQFNLVLGLHPLDSLGVIPCYYDPANNIIQPDYRYHINISFPDAARDSITADTIVPKKATLIPNFNYEQPAGEGYTTSQDDTTTFIHYPEVDMHYPVSVRIDSPGLDSPQSYNYLVELYCLEEFSTDLEFTTVFLGQENPPADMKENYYQASGETIRRINIMSKFISKQHTDGKQYVSLTDYRQGFIFYGRYKVTAYIMDDNYYKYKYMPEGYYFGGVKNGFGCFGSASGGVMYTKIVR